MSENRDCKHCKTGPKPAPYFYWCGSCTHNPYGYASPKVDRFEPRYAKVFPYISEEEKKVK